MPEDKSTGQAGAREHKSGGTEITEPSGPIGKKLTGDLEFAFEVRFEGHSATARKPTTRFNCRP
jgi:hypothetical protein